MTQNDPLSQNCVIPAQAEIQMIKKFPAKRDNIVALSASRDVYPALIGLAPKIAKRTQCCMGFCRADERSVIRRMWVAHSADNAALIRPTVGVVLENNRISTVYPCWVPACAGMTS